MQKAGAALDNRHVVSYNPVLLQVFDCHINVEICTGLHAVKCIYKYVHKGHDRAVAEISGADGLLDEIKNFVEGRWVSLKVSSRASRASPLATTSLQVRRNSDS